MWDKSQERLHNRILAFEFIKELWSCSIPKIAIENPVGWLNKNWMPPSQITNPKFFGSPYSKEVCLWLKNLPPLIHTCHSPGLKKVSNHVNSRMSQAAKSKIKSKFFPEMAKEMANQWS